MNIQTIQKIWWQINCVFFALLCIAIFPKESTGAELPNSVPRNDINIYSGTAVIQTYRSLNFKPQVKQTYLTLNLGVSSLGICQGVDAGYPFVPGPASPEEFNKVINWLDLNTSLVSGFARSFWFFPVQEDCVRDSATDSDPNDKSSRLYMTWAILKYGSNVYDHANGLILRMLSGQPEEIAQVSNVMAILNDDGFRYFYDSRAWGRCDGSDPAHPFIYGEDPIEGITCTDYPFHRQDVDYYHFKALNADGNYCFPKNPYNGYYCYPVDSDVPIHWDDWQPISGENAWVAIAAMHFYKLTGNQDALEVAKKAAKGAMLLQVLNTDSSVYGGIRMAPQGVTSDAIGFISPFYQISTENNLSWYAALRMLYQETGEIKYQDAMSHIITYLQRAFKQDDVDGNPTNGNQPGFIQGAYFSGGKWQQAMSFAVDCQTWAIDVLGAATIDEMFGAGAAMAIWRSTKTLAGVRNSNGSLNGVDFTNWRGVGRESMVSYEWTGGAILAARILQQYYFAKGRQDFFDEAKTDADQMTEFTLNKAVRVDDYQDSNTTSISILAWPYASGSGHMLSRPIGFGWYAPSEEVLSLASTAWASYINRKYIFNPFWLENHQYFSCAVMSRGAYFIDGANRESIASNLNYYAVSRTATGSLKLMALTKTGRVVMQTTSINDLSIEYDGTVNIKGKCSVNSTMGYNFEAFVKDVANPGAAKDIFSIKITGPNNYNIEFLNKTITGGDIAVGWQ